VKFDRARSIRLRYVVRSSRTRGWTCSSKNISRSIQIDTKRSKMDLAEIQPKSPRRTSDFSPTRAHLEPRDGRRRAEKEAHHRWVSIPEWELKEIVDRDPRIEACPRRADLAFGIESSWGGWQMRVAVTRYLSNRNQMPRPGNCRSGQGANRTKRVQIFRRRKLRSRNSKILPVHIFRRDRRTLDQDFRVGLGDKLVNGQISLTVSILL
jgi:hypothetical protein